MLFRKLSIPFVWVITIVSLIGTYWLYVSRPEIVDYSSRSSLSDIVRIDYVSIERMPIIITSGIKNRLVSNRITTSQENFYLVQTLNENSIIVLSDIDLSSEQNLILTAQNADQVLPPTYRSEIRTQYRRYYQDADPIRIMQHIPYNSIGRQWLYGVAASIILVIVNAWILIHSLRQSRLTQLDLIGSVDTGEYA